MWGVEGVEGNGREYKVLIKSHFRIFRAWDVEVAAGVKGLEGSINS